MTAAAARESTLSDEALVRLAVSGDLEAFESLVRRHRAVVLRVVARIAGTNEAEDLAQDAFLRAFHRLPQYRGESPFRAWLLRIAHNTALNAAARRRPVDSLDDEESDDASVPNGERPPAEALEVNERRDRLALKLREIPPAHRAVLVLRDLEGLSYEEIAEITEAPLGSVKGRLHRARRELIDAMRRNTYDWELPA